MDNVSLNTGYVSDEDMRKAFVESDWVILPYNSASQSGVIIDAYKYSRPVVAFEVGAIAEQIQNGISGYLVPADDKHAFIEKVKTVSVMPEEQYDRLSSTAYKYGCEKYAASGAVIRFLELFE